MIFGKKVAVFYFQVGVVAVYEFIDIANNLEGDSLGSQIFCICFFFGIWHIFLGTMILSQNQLNIHDHIQYVQLSHSNMNGK